VSVAAKASAKAPEKAPEKAPANAPAKSKPVAKRALASGPHGAPETLAKKTKPAQSAKADKGSKAPKAPKLRQKAVRDSFTMPEADFSLVATLKARALAGKRETKKSELLRAGLQALAAMDGPTLLAALQALEPVKTGRPKRER
jgi:hypothetical protein